MNRCDDCMRDRDYCPDCFCEGCENQGHCEDCEELGLYLSPDSYREEDR
jgi:hypothetical protein